MDYAEGMQPGEFFGHLWRDFTGIAPAAGEIREHFARRGERVENDHVAFRTFNQPPFDLAGLEPLLRGLGYEPLAAYHFPVKHLRAVGYVHPSRQQPRIFLSELLLEQCSPQLAATCRSLAEQVPAERLRDPSVFWAGRLWTAIDYTTYERLADESEYAAWLAALGFHANHFTVGVNALRTLRGIPEVLDFVESVGFAINEVGGRVKGTAAELLEQGSTLADRQPVEFSGGARHVIPTCYYEFALRYPDVSGALYDGFVAASADRIFESTDRQPIKPAS
jgi:hypothetical protein